MLPSRMFFDSHFDRKDENKKKKGEKTVYRRKLDEKSR